MLHMYAVVFMVIYRKTLFQGIHNFIHLNLAISLFFALITFVSGIQVATEHKVNM